MLRIGRTLIYLFTIVLVFSGTSYAQGPQLTENEAREILESHIDKWNPRHRPEKAYIEYVKFSNEFYIASYRDRTMKPSRWIYLLITIERDVKRLDAESLIRIHQRKYGAAENEEDMKVIAESCLLHYKRGNPFQIVSYNGQLRRHPDYPWDEEIMSNIQPPRIYKNDEDKWIYEMYTFNRDFGGRISLFRFLFDEREGLVSFEEEKLAETLPRRLR